MGEYDSAIALALRLIAKKGTSITLRHPTNAAPPSATAPQVPGAVTNSDQTPKGVFIPYPIDQIDRDRIQNGDEQVWIAAAALVADPSVGDTVIRAGRNSLPDEWWRVEAVGYIRPATDVIVWKLQVRQWPRRLSRA